MQPLGTDLKQLREKDNLSLRQVSDDTRITLRHLESLEAGRYAELPGGMYNRAFVRAYCEYLGLDAQPYLLRYDQEAASLGKEGVKTRVRHIPLDSEFRIPSLLVWSAMLLCSITGLFFNRKWIAEVFSPYFSGPVTVTPSPPAPAPRPVQPPSSAPVLAAASAMPSATTAQDARLVLELVAAQKCWLSVKSDGGSAAATILEPGDARSFEASESLTVVLGNAGGVSARINERPAKPFGKAGQVVTVLIDKSNLQGLLQAPGS
jgi:cytoskeleton protein RodZ